ncbi:hypothetical protein [Gracilinema caldarium]|uniref:hypothetical protein n=1 Tax=Gracilinema caldarium TaxID=215591 RepID=UPI0026ED1A6B|nr:hypothetical protein [Gracilinema caldarium]
MELDFSSKLTYVPKFNGNREASAAEQFTVVYRNPTPALKSRLLPRPELRFRIDNEGRVAGGETIVSQDRKAIIDGMLVRIDGLSYKLDGETKLITDAKTLWEAPIVFDELIDELADHFRNELEKKVDQKN